LKRPLFRWATNDISSDVVMKAPKLPGLRSR
jgi:hypothetical protein